MLRCAVAVMKDKKPFVDSNRPSGRFSGVKTTDSSGREPVREDAQLIGKR